MTTSNRKKGPSGRFEAVEITSTNHRLAATSPKLLDHGVSRAKSGSTDSFCKWLSIGFSSVDALTISAQLERDRRFPRIQRFEPTQNSSTGFSTRVGTLRTILSIY